VIAVLFSVVFGFISLPVSITFFGFLSRVVQVPEFGLPSLVAIVGAPSFISIILATYLSTIVFEAEQNYRETR